VSVAPSPADVYERAVDEGRRRLDAPLVEQIATAFIAGVTIIFGIVALAVVEAELGPDLGRGVATVGGALGFGIGLVFLVAGRTELFSENFFDPVAASIEGRTRRDVLLLIRLWSVTLVLNLVGSAVLVAVLTVDGALPGESPTTLVRLADELATKSWEATFATAVMAGALVTLLSYMLSAVDSVAARLAVAYLVGFFLALGPFDHVVVSATHLLFGVWLSDAVGYGDLLRNVAITVPGNLVGGLLLITLSHTAQVKGR
jgi:formate-nitrite transporter family protein